VTGTVTPSPASVAFGQTTALKWTITNPSSCSQVPTLDGKAVSVLLPPTVHIAANTLEYRRLFVQAVGTPNTRVVLARDLDLDLTGCRDIAVRQGVTITSEAAPPVVANAPSKLTIPGRTPTPPPARNAHTLGPRISTTSKPSPLLHVYCGAGNAPSGDNARLIGFRLQGPHMGSTEGDENLTQGIRVSSCTGSRSRTWRSRGTTAGTRSSTAAEAQAAATHFEGTPKAALVVLSGDARFGQIYDPVQRTFSTSNLYRY